MFHFGDPENKNKNNFQVTMSNSKFSPPPIPADSWCRTRYEDSVDHTFVWTIEQFSQRKEMVDEAIESAKFSSNRQA
jgi:hypothetical protein